MEAPVSIRGGWEPKLIVILQTEALLVNCSSPPWELKWTLIFHMHSGFHRYEDGSVFPPDSELCGFAPRRLFTQWFSGKELRIKKPHHLCVTVPWWHGRNTVTQSPAMLKLWLLLEETSAIFSPPCGESHSAGGDLLKVKWIFATLTFCWRRVPEKPEVSFTAKEERDVCWFTPGKRSNF